MSISSESTFIIDTRSPEVISVNSLIDDGLFGVGDTIQFSITFDEMVTVTGIPQITLETGDDDGVAYYVEKEDSTLIFRYIVELGHNSDALDYVSSSSFNVEGGSIYDMVGNSSNLFLPEPNNTNSLSFNYQITIDTEAPSAGIVLDGFDIDQYWTNQDSSLSFFWSDFTDNISGIHRYDISIGLSPNQHDILDLLHVYNNTSFTVSNLSLQNSITYYVNVRAIDNAGNISDVVSSDGITVDTEKPSFSYLYENEIGFDPEFISDYDSLIIYWSVLDTTSGINIIEVSIDSDSSISDLTEWFNVDDLNYYVFNDLELVNGNKYYTKIRSFDNAGNESDAFISNGFIVDTSPPVGSLVLDGIEFDFIYTQNDSTIISSWLPFNDSISGIAFYEFAVGLAGSDSNIIDWQNNGLDTNAIIENIPLASGSTYISKVRAIDNIGNISSEYTSSGIMVDVDIPISGTVIDGIYSDEDWTNQTDFFAASWSNFQDTSSGIKKFEYAIGTISDTSKVLSWKTNNLDTMVYESDLFLEDGIQYFIYVRAIDNSNNISEIVSSDGMFVDLAAPQLSEVFDGENNNDYDWQSSDSSLYISWLPADTINNHIYEYSVGYSPGDTSVIEWCNVGDELNVYVQNLFLENGTKYFSNLRAYDLANNISNVQTSDGITIDNEVPILGVVFDGLLDELDYTSSSDSLSGRWSNFTDSLSGLSHYEYAIGSLLDTIEIIDWTITSDTFMVGYNLSLFNDSIYYVSVRSLDSALNVSMIARSNGLTVDTQRPTSGIVYDGVSTDEDWTNSIETLSGGWTGFYDEETGIRNYDYCIGTSPYSDNVIEWEDVGLDTSFIQNNLSLDNGIRYYITIRAFDMAENIRISVSDGIIVDNTAPIISNVFDGYINSDIDWQSISDSITISWTYEEENNRNLEYFDYSLGTTPSDSNIIGWTFAGNNISVFITNLNLIEGNEYYGNVRAYDEAGNVSLIASSDGFGIDLTSPDPGEVFDGIENDYFFTSSSDTLEARWNTFYDSLSGIDFFEIGLDTIPGSTSLTGWVNVSTDTQFIFTDISLLHGKNYFISVRSADNAGNFSEISFSNGITVDLIGPTVGQIIDGDSTDVVFLGTSDTLKTAWFDFKDDISGIKEFQLALGTAPYDTDQVNWFSVDRNISNYIFQEPELVNNATYYVSIKALDNVGNFSDVLTTNGILIDGEPPSIISQSIPEGSFFPLKNNFNLNLKVSEPLKDAWVNVSDFDSGIFDYSFDLDSLIINFYGPFSSLDSFQISISLIDLIGNKSDTLVQNHYTAMHADFNYDLKVDVTDLAIFIDAWKNNDLEYELGPVNGIIPNFTLDKDSVFSLSDALVFSRMWYWDNETSFNLITENENYGRPLKVEQVGKNISLMTPENTFASEITIYSDDNIQFEFAPNDSDRYKISSTRKSNEPISYSHIACINDKKYNHLKVNKLNYKIHGDLFNESEISIYYHFVGEKGSDISKGDYQLTLKPMPEEFLLHQNYPNPFNSSTMVKFNIPKPSLIDLSVYDLTGRKVAVLLSQNVAPGFHEIIWNGKDDKFLNSPSGVYFIMLKTNQYRKAKKMLLIK